MKLAYGRKEEREETLTDAVHRYDSPWSRNKAKLNKAHDGRNKNKMCRKERQTKKEIAHTRSEKEKEEEQLHAGRYISQGEGG